VRRRSARATGSDMKSVGENGQEVDRDSPRLGTNNDNQAQRAWRYRQGRPRDLRVPSGTWMIRPDVAGPAPAPRPLVLLTLLSSPSCYHLPRPPPRPQRRALSTSSPTRRSRPSTPAVSPLASAIDRQTVISSRFVCPPALLTSHAQCSPGPPSTALYLLRSA
jgi:hypothetical protein